MEVLIGAREKNKIHKFKNKEIKINKKNLMMNYD